MKSAAANYTGGGLPDGGNNDQSGKPRFIAVTRLEDVQAVRCAEFHPHGSVYAVGSNSQTLRICAYPKVTDIRSVYYYPCGETERNTVLWTEGVDLSITMCSRHLSAVEANRELEEEF